MAGRYRSPTVEDEEDGGSDTGVQYAQEQANSQHETTNGTTGSSKKRKRTKSGSAKASGTQNTKKKDSPKKGKGKEKETATVDDSGGENESGEESPKETKKRRRIQAKEAAIPQRQERDSPIRLDKQFSRFEAPATQRFTPAVAQEYKHEYVTKHQIKGVWCCFNSMPQEAPKEEVAGYLNLKDTRELADFIYSIEDSILKPFKTSKEVSFGSTLPVKTQYPKAKIMSALENPGFSEHAKNAILNGVFPLSNDDLKCRQSDATLAYANWFCAMNKIIERHPNQFPPPTSQHDHVLWHHSQENWSRADHVLRYYLRNKQGARAAKGIKQVKLEPARQPLFATPADTKNIRDDDTGKITASDPLNDLALKEFSARLDMEQEEEDEIDDPNHPAEENEQQALADAETEIGRIASSKQNLQNGKLDGSKKRPNLSASDRLKASQILSRFHSVKFEGEAACEEAAHVMALSALYRGQNVAEAVGEMDNVDQETIDRFWETQRKLAVVTATTPGYKKACEFLGINPKDPKLEGTTLVLKPWQAMDSSWMLIQEETVIGGGVIANDCGTGKTYSALAAIRSDYLRKKKSGAKGPFKATVIFAPSPLVNQWMDQYDNKMRGALDTYRFFGTKDSVSGTMADRVLGSLDELNTLLEGLDVNDVETSRVVIFTSYGTWATRCLHATKEEVKDLNEADFDDEFLDEEEEAEIRRLGGKKAFYKIVWKSQVVTGKIGRVVCDEAHYVKNPRTRAAECIRQLYPEHKWFLTATPMLNRVSDYRGYLWQLWKEIWRGLNLEGTNPLEMFKIGFNPRETPVYAASAQNAKQAPMVIRTLDSMPARSDATSEFIDTIEATDPERAMPLYLLDPDKFRSIGVDNQWDVDTAKCLAKMLPMVQVRRTMESFVDLEDGSEPFRVGSAIPAFHIKTVVTTFNTDLKKKYQQIVKQFSDKLKGIEQRVAPVPTKGNEAKDVFVNQDALRQVQHACFDLDLSHLTKSVKKRQKSRKKKGEPAVGGLAEINKWRKLDEDCGVSYKWERVRADPTYPVYTDRISMATTIVSKSPKMAYLLKLLAEWCLEGGEKVLIMTKNPMVQWDIEGLLALLGYDVLTIRAEHTHAERRKIVQNFNDAEYRCHALIIGFALGAYGLDFHLDCAKLIIIELPHNVNSLIQAFGRIHRVGQIREQQIRILTVEGTYDEYLEGFMAEKFIPQISAEGDLGDLQGKARHDSAAEILRSLLDQEISRAGWTDSSIRKAEKAKAQAERQKRLEISRGKKAEIEEKRARRANLKKKPDYQAIEDDFFREETDGSESGDHENGAENATLKSSKPDVQKRGKTRVHPSTGTIAAVQVPATSAPAVNAAAPSQPNSPSVQSPSSEVQAEQNQLGGMEGGSPETQSAKRRRGGRVAKNQEAELNDAPLAPVTRSRKATARPAAAKGQPTGTASATVNRDTVRRPRASAKSVKSAEYVNDDEETEISPPPTQQPRPKFKIKLKVPPKPKP